MAVAPHQIWYDQTQMFRTVSYYVQQMYATNRGTHVLRLTMPQQQGKKTMNVPVANQEGQNGLFATACYDKDAADVIVKVVNTSKTAQPLTLNLNGMTASAQAPNAMTASASARTLTLSHSAMDAENTIQNPALITPRPGTVPLVSSKKQAVITDTLPAMSFRIYRIRK